MRATVASMIALLLAGCQQYEPPDLFGLSASQKASELALRRYFACMEPIVAKAKVGPPLSEQQIAVFGYHCRPQLEDAARKRELYFSQDPKRHDPELWAAVRADRIRLHEKDLAGAFWCDFHQCLTM